MQPEMRSMFHDGLSEKCGVFGIHGHPEASHVTFSGLYAVQHRGQESAGIATSDGRSVRSHRGMGLVSEVFDAKNLAELKGHISVGHVRYASGAVALPDDTQPLTFRYRLGQIAIAHNGNLVNAAAIRRKLETLGSIFQTGSDVEVVAHLVARAEGLGIEDAIVRAFSDVRGAYSIIALTERLLIGARDPNGIRPLSLGKLGDAYILCSETCGIDSVGGEVIRDVLPGEVVFIGEHGVRSVRASEPAKRALCVFEHIYFARPDSDLNGLNVHAARKEMGRRLARLSPVEADLVMGVPDSSISAASGYAEEAGIPLEMGLVKNRYIGRTFIQPTQSMRDIAVRLKLNPLRRVLENKRVVLVDDSIVRGTTSRYIVALLKHAGAKEVHLRIASPPFKHVCHYGIITSSPGELMSATRDAEQIRQHVKADTIGFLSLEELLDVVESDVYGYCDACFTGNYPVDVSEVS